MHRCLEISRGTSFLKKNAVHKHKNQSSRPRVITCQFEIFIPDAMK